MRASLETDGLLDAQAPYGACGSEPVSSPGGHASGMGGGRTFLHDGSSNIKTRYDSIARLRSSMTSAFHTLVYMDTWKCISTVVLTYFCIIFFYGVLWTAIGVTSPECNLDINTLLDGFLFSLESLATIGYSTASGDIFFGGCYTAALTLFLEICTKLFVDSCLIGVLYVRLTRPTLRAGTFLTSDMASLRRVNGKLYFTCQFMDTKQQPLLLATLRLYSSHKNTVPDSTANPMRYHQMKVSYPENDCAPMLMYMPQLVVHEIDKDSPLMPTQNYMDNNADTILRSDYPVGRTAGLSATEVRENKAVASYLRESDFEIFGLVDGTDSISGMPTQMRFSYRYRANELKWNIAFVSCVSLEPETGAPLIDYSAFQKTIPCPGNIVFSEERRAPDIFECIV